MIISKLTLNNFRQFHGQQAIEFSQNPNQNITLILGDNTSGKTTLLQAFLWVFYGSANFKTKDILLNAQVAEQVLTTETAAEMFVELELEHEGINYILTRKQRYTTKNNKLSPGAIQVDLKYIQDGQMNDLKKYLIETKINEILPKDLSNYFLYDTERFGNITSRSDVTKSVKGILGLTVLDNIIDHLGTTTRSDTVLHEFSSNLNTKGDEEALIAYDKIKTAEEDKTDALNLIEEKKIELENYNQIIKEKQVILKELAETAILQKDKEIKTKELESEKKLLNDVQQKYIEAFKSNILGFLGQNLYQRALVSLTNAKLDKKSISDMNANAIRDIIKRGICVCGTNIEDGNDAHQHLLEEIRYLPPESIGTLINTFNQRAKMLLGNGENYFDNMETHYKYIIKHNTKIGQLIDEIDSINKKIDGQDSVAHHQRGLLNAEANQQKILTELGGLKEKINNCTKIIDENQAIYENNLKASSKNKEILTYIEYAKNILDWVTNRKNTREKEIKEQLEERVNYYFKKMYHGKRKVSIDDKFQVTLITTDLTNEVQTDESQGLETVKNFAFISGLVDLAKQKLSDEYEKDSEAYPLILDAPFSNADDKHVKNISEVLPNVANQLILIVMAKDWNYAEEALQDKVGKEYYLEKGSEIITKINGVGINV